MLSAPADYRSRVRTWRWPRDLHAPLHAPLRNRFRWPRKPAALHAVPIGSARISSSLLDDRHARGGILERSKQPIRRRQQRGEHDVVAGIAQRQIVEEGECANAAIAHRRRNGAPPVTLLLSRLERVKVSIRICGR